MPDIPSPSAEVEPVVTERSEGNPGGVDSGLDRSYRLRALGHAQLRARDRERVRRRSRRRAAPRHASAVSEPRSAAPEGSWSPPAEASLTASGVQKMAMTLPPVNQRRIRAVAAAMDAGLITDAEAQRLLGFLMMRGRSSSPRTARRREAKLRELDLLEVTPEESAAVEFGQLVEAGELSAEEAELRAGRWFLAHVAVKEARERTGDGRAPRSIA